MELQARLSCCQCCPSKVVLRIRQTPSRRAGRPAVQVHCAQTTWQEARPDQHSKQTAATGLIAAAAAASLLLPFQAAAVSGGASKGLQCVAGLSQYALRCLSATSVQPPKFHAGSSIPISGQDFSNKDLHKDQYTKGVMRQTNFSGSNMRGVSMFGVVAKEAKFVGTDLSTADLSSGDFEGADFTNANLSGAAVANARFKNAKLQGSDWTDVVLRKDQIRALCETASGQNPSTGNDTRESLMCP